MNGIDQRRNLTIGFGRWNCQTSAELVCKGLFKNSRQWPKQTEPSGCGIRLLQSCLPLPRHDALQAAGIHEGCCLVQSRIKSHCEQFDKEKGSMKPWGTAVRPAAEVSLPPLLCVTPRYRCTSRSGSHYLEYCVTFINSGNLLTVEKCHYLLI